MLQTWLKNNYNNLALATNQQKEKRRRLNLKEFRHLIPVANPESVIISMKAEGTVRLVVLDRTYSLQQKNVSQVPTTITESRTFSFNLPDHIVNDHDFKFNHVMAFLGEGNVEFVYNVKTQIRNGKVIPIHYIPYFVLLSRLLCWLNFEGFFFNNVILPGA